MTSRRALLTGAGAVLAAHLTGCQSAGAKTPPSAATSPPGRPVMPATPSRSSRPLRFVVGSDGHLGDPKAPGDPYPAFVKTVNALHAQASLDFVVVNGDITQGGVKRQQQVKGVLAGLKMPSVVVPGNHDELTRAQWRKVWRAEPNLVERFGDRSIILANTSNSAGDYLCAKRSWLQEALHDQASQQDVLVFMHITPDDWTKFGVDCPDIRKVLSQTPNLRAVFNGHDHDQDGQMTSAGVDYFFDAHLGGHWGTDYVGFRLSSLDGNTLTTQMVRLDGTLLPETSLSW